MMQHMLSTQEAFSIELAILLPETKDSLSFWSKDLKRNRLNLCRRRQHPIIRMKKKKQVRANLHCQKQLKRWPQSLHKKVI